MTRTSRVLITLLSAVCLLAAPALADEGTPNDDYPLTPPFASFGSAVISNGTVALGVNNEGHLNVAGFGVRFLPTGFDAIFVACLCEGWGVGDAVGGTQGWASISTGGVVNMALISFGSTASTATSVVNVGNTFKVTHDFRPSVTPMLYEIEVIIENISGAAIGDLRYTRGMDWDVFPTPFNEFVTIQGTAAEPTVLYADNNGFQIVGPLFARGSLGAVGDFVDFGPRDHGAHFDFGFGPLAAGATRKFTIYYGAAGSEANALAAVAAVGAQVYSFGQPNVFGGPDLGQPNTFIFAYRPLIEVDIDIKFCSDPNGFNCKSRGKTPLTIFGTAGLDVNDIDISSLRLCEAGNLANCTTAPVSFSIADRGDPTTDIGAAMCAVDPVTGAELDWLNQDGFDDLDVAFSTQEVVAVIGCAGLAKGDASLTLVLVGQTLSGTPIGSLPIGDVGIDQLLIQNN